jgi:ribosome assembly protein YihI (activator of Der GTPase)
MKSKFKVRDYLYVKEIIESYEDEEILNDFLEKFEVDKEISYGEYYDFCYNYIDDMSETYYINCNWNDEYDY